MTAAIPFEPLADAAVGVLGFSLLALGAAGCVAFLHRWYAGQEIPDGVAVLAGVTAVAFWLNTRSALGDAIIGETPLLDPTTAVYTVATFTASAIAADGGRRLGDHLARESGVVASPRTLDEVSQLVRSAGRVRPVTLPETVADVDGYDPVDERTKVDLAGRTLLLPDRLTLEELRSRLIDRLERDFGVGAVDLELSESGAVEYLAVGSRPAGIGPTLAPGSVAVAIRADPAADASPGDTVEVWDAGEGSPRRIAGVELRATADDVATLALDAPDGDLLDLGRSYRLVTLPGSAGAGRQFVSLLRGTLETVTMVNVDDGPLAGARIGSLPVDVVAIEREAEAIALPHDDERLAKGDVAFLLGRPEALRRLDER